MAKKRGDTPAKQEKQGLGARWGWLMVLVAVGAVLFFWGRAWLGLDAGGGSPGPEMIAQGATLYGTSCAVCHGPGAAGQVATLPKGGINPAGGYFAPALNGTGHAWHHPPDTLFGIIKHGSPAADSPMKGFAEKLSDQDIRAVMAYFQSLWPPQIRRRYFSAHGQ